jgi:hypothetical protein
MYPEIATISSIVSLDHILRYYQVKYSFEWVRVALYSVWTAMAWWICVTCDWESNSIRYPDLVHPMLRSVNIAYLYEMVVHSPDTAHTIHHVLAIVAQLYGLMVSMAVPNDLTTLELAAAIHPHMGFISSIFSSLRTIYRDDLRIGRTIDTVYKISYLVSKPGLVLIYYYCLATSDMWATTTTQIRISGCLFIPIHLIQFYFSWLIARSLYTTICGSRLARAIR